MLLVLANFLCFYLLFETSGLIISMIISNAELTKSQFAISLYKLFL